MKLINYVGSMYSWQPLSDHSLVLYTRPSQAWLLDVGPCPDLPYTPFISVSSTAGQISVGFDKVMTTHQQFPCYIKTIRPLDLGRVRAAQAERRKVETVPRESSAPKQ